MTLLLFPIVLKIAGFTVWISWKIYFNGALWRQGSVNSGEGEANRATKLRQHGYCACSLWKRQECQLLSSKIYIFWYASRIFNFNEIPFSPHKNVICVVHLICKCFWLPLLVCHNINLKLFFFNFLITFSKINIHFYVASSGKRGMEFWT